MLAFLTKAGYCLMIIATFLECSSKIERGRPVIEKQANIAENTDNDMENTEAAGQVKLAASFIEKASSLEVEYKVRNATNNPIYIFNVVLDTDQIETLSPFKFYSCLREDGTIVLAKAIPKLPSLASVEVRDIPFATKVEAGSEFAEKVEVPLPLEEYSPYFQKDFNSKVEERVSEKIYLVVQFIREQEGLEVKETKIPNAVKVYHRELIAKAETLKSDKRPIEVRVNRRLDTFERF